MPTFRNPSLSHKHRASGEIFYDIIYQQKIMVIVTLSVDESYMWFLIACTALRLSTKHWSPSSSIHNWSAVGLLSFIWLSKFLDCNIRTYWHYRFLFWFLETRCNTALSKLCLSTIKNVQQLWVLEFLLSTMANITL